MNYDIFLFYNLAKDMGKISDDFAYDEIYDHYLEKWYKEFESSGYNDVEVNLYECVVKYLETINKLKG